MTPVTRRRILQYGIAIDLVILATGIGMLLPVSAPVLGIAYTAAVLLSVWKGGWRGGLTALLLSVLAIVLAFPPLAHARFLLPFTAAAAVLGGIWSAASKPRSAAAEPPLSIAAAPPPHSIDEERLAREEAEREARERAEEQVRLAREEAERAQREHEERIAQEREEAAPWSAAAEPPLSKAAAPPPHSIDEERLAREEAEREARERAEEQARLAREEAERAQREHEERIAQEREEAARLAREEAEREARERAEEQARLAREEAERAQREHEERIAQEREEAARLAREEAERAAREEIERVAREREEAEREAHEREQAEREARERAEEQARLAREEAERAQREHEERIAQEREEAARAARERAEQLERELAAMRAETERLRVAAQTPAPPPAKPQPPAPPKPSLVDTITGWFRRPAPATRPPIKRGAPNLVTKRVNGNDTAARKAAAAKPAPRPPARKTTAGPRKPRLLLLERRRGTADTVVPRLRQRGTEVVVVERWVDAVDEIFRFKPDAIFLDVEHPEFERVHRTITETSTNLPMILTGRSSSAAPTDIRYAAFVPRPYDMDDLLKLAQHAMSHPEDLLAEQSMPRSKPAPRAIPVAPPSPPPPPPAPVQRAPLIPVATLSANDLYEVECFNCRVRFDAVDADWCSCLTKERTLVCTNCLACFCKAPPAYKEKFWVEAPPRLFERKTSEARRQQASLPVNPPSSGVRRPLVLCVEDDEEIQAIVQRVCSNLDYGFVFATNGQDGLDLARAYQPNLILSDAFMPKLDGREMCRLLKEEAPNADWKMVVMTGLYTDTKYRSEALKRFHVDDYIAKPVAITDLISLLQKHLEGVPMLEPPEDLHELHRAEAEAEDTHDGEDVPLAEVIDMPVRNAEPKPAPRDDSYSVACVNCRQTFDATRAEWCRCVGRDNTLVCEHCGECFCKAPAAYKERFWVDAPSSLFERKMIGSKRSLGARTNPAPFEVKRPLILLVEDDENVQLIVRTVVTSMGYGFVVGANGQEGLQLAREYNPDLILSDAFMPKLDGREMCRLLKEDPATSRAKAIIMTGLYTDRKYRNEALDYFKVDDYVAKPLAVDDLIKLFKKHLPQEVSATM